jgi:2-amino-4-hydroxy-6-hydroxymethyldihydropteridine diphosphokinase
VKQLAYIGFGSNLGDSLSILQMVKDEINAREGLSLEKVSPIYRAQPVDVPDRQNDYINAVFELETSLEPESILIELAAIEERHGRVRGKVKNTARTLDLDLLLVGNKSIQGKNLTLPHPRIFQRAFVLFPLFDLSPELEIPGQGIVRKLLDNVRDQEIERL